MGNPHFKAEFSMFFIIGSWASFVIHTILIPLNSKNNFGFDVLHVNTLNAPTQSQGSGKDSADR